MKIEDKRWPAWLLKHLPVKFSRKLVTIFNAAPQVSGNEKYQLLIDVSVIYQSDARTGIKRVVRSLLLQLWDEPPHGYRVCPVFATRQHGYCYATINFLDQPLLTQKNLEECVAVQQGDVFLGLDLAAHLLPLHQSQILNWKRTGVKVHMVVYDILPLQHPEWFNKKTTRNFKRWISWVAVYADTAVCISGTVKLELQTWLNVRFGLPIGMLPLSVIALGANIQASSPSDGIPQTAEFLLARLRTTPSVLMVGTLEPRKGYEQALAAFELLWKKNKQSPLLVIVGRPGWKTDALQIKLREHHQANKRLFWLENVSDEFLERLYTACSGVLIASQAEGFGLPLVEAALHRKPILARKLAVFNELNMSGVSYFATDDPLVLAQAVEKWITASLNHQTSRLSTVEIEVPTWHLAAKQLLAALELQQPSTLTLNEGDANNGVICEPTSGLI